MKMAVVFLVLLLTLSSGAPAIRGATLPSSEALDVRGGDVLKSATFLSPPFILQPGSVADKYYYDIAFPRGHVALKSFNGEVVDALGTPVPLHETYLHHWAVRRYYAAKDTTAHRLATIPARNAGVCEGDTHGQYYGLGSETRRTATWVWVPDPYAIEAGDPAAPPEGYVERWMLNVHAIDTRGAVDRLGCIECRCDLYNVTPAATATADRPGYAGGMLCCYDQTRCQVEKGFVDGEARKLFFRYTVVWPDWSAAAAAAVVPVRIYVFDVTHRTMPVGCMVEYQVEECSAEKRAKSDCVHVKVTKQVVPRGGDLVYAVGHQHAGAIGSTLHGQDGRLLCESTPTYGGGVEAGDEEGYVVGMSTCYPKPGTVRVHDGEVLTVVSNYSSERRHTGVMGVFYVLVADGREQQPQLRRHGCRATCEQKCLAAMCIYAK